MKIRGWLVISVVLAGCGLGHSQSLDDGGAGGGDAGGGGSDSGLVVGCPATAPGVGSACGMPDLHCEYGQDPSLPCNTLAMCERSRWGIRFPSVGPPCPTPRAGETKGCPSTYASVHVGDECPYQGLACGYRGEGYCVCTIPFSGPVQIDASTTPIWVCDKAPYGCPSPRPHAGAPCTREDEYCDYGACTLPLGAAMRCVSGAWKEEQFACPL